MQCFFNSLYMISEKFIIETNAELLLILEELCVKYPGLYVWWGALSTTLLISIIPYLVLYFIPLNNTPEYESHLKICLSLAAGGLLGDAFLHLIPESINLNRTQSPNHSQSVGLWILTGFIGFFVVEKCVRIAKNYSNSKISDKVSEKHNKSVVNNYNNNNKFIKNCVNQQKLDLKVNAISEDIKIAGYLNLVADLVHNFTDGLAIGSSFMSGQSVGLVTGLAIMVHEIPHEIGDYAVLIKSGVSRKKAMSLQLLTAVGALAGTVVSVGLGTSDEGTDWVLPFTGGGFIYIGTVTILPELTDQSDFKQSSKELFALIFGLFLMTLIV